MNQTELTLHTKLPDYVIGDAGKIILIAFSQGYDAIHVGAAAVTVHEALIEQLRSPGRYAHFSLLLSLTPNPDSEFLPKS